jgi:hypothetical protein
VNACKKLLSFPQYPELQQILTEGQALLKVVREKALERVKQEGIDNPRFSCIDDLYYNNLQDYAIVRCDFY